MKTLRHLSLLIIFCCAFTSSKAQWVTIPDATFRSYLQTTFPGCISGTRMDTTCAGIVTDTALDCSNKVIQDLTGIQYFNALLHLKANKNSITLIPAFPPNCENIELQDNYLTNLPPLPSTLRNLNIDNNQLTTLPTLPSGLISLSVEGKGGLGSLTSVPPLPATLQILNCSSHVLITTLPALPDSLKRLDCSRCQIATLPALPAGLTILKCDLNRLTNLPSLPSSLLDLNCQNNSITTLPTLPDSLQTLACGRAPFAGLPPTLPAGLTFLWVDRGNFTTLPPLPPLLKQLWIWDVPLTALPTLPSTVYEIYIVSTNITSLPNLPQSLTNLSCYGNQLTSLPALPDSLRTLACYGNKIVSIPGSKFPPNLTLLQVQNNLLASLPEFGNKIEYCNLSNNPNLHCLPRLTKFLDLIFDSVNIACVPNYGNVTTCTPALNTIPICDPLNTNGCQSIWNIKGNAFNDVNGDCTQQTGDKDLSYLKVKLLKNGVVQQQTYTGANGMYAFDTDTGSFITTVDTSGIPFKLLCPANGLNSAIVTPLDSLKAGLNFALQCKAGFDISVQSLAPRFFARPGAVNIIEVKAGDVARAFGSPCNTTNVSGQLVVTLMGPVTYTGPAAGALTPVVNGNTLIYTVSNWATVAADAFNFNTTISTSAQAGQQICFSTTATPTGGDYNTGNNQFLQCFTIRNSYDPNDKQVSPADNINNTAQWLTYTIRFQNTGNAPAIHIYAIDTLDGALDINSFQLLAYSHLPVVNIYNDLRYARFTFPNINLADSLHNEPESHGYIQYRVKTLPGLNCGTQIGNAAHIYFDFNAPVATNAAINRIYMSSTTSEQNTICNGETFSWRNRTLAATGLYTDTLQGAFACDSFVTLNLSVLQPIVENQNATVCNGETYSWRSRTLTATGSYADTLQAVSSCDSIITLQLQVLQGTEVSESAAICDGETYTWHNRSLTGRGTYTDTMQTTAGCDSVVILSLELNTGYSVTVDDVIDLSGVYVLPSGITVTAPGTYTDTLQTIFGCDSIIATHLTFLDGIENIGATATMQLYPNPAQDVVMINLSDNLTGGTLTLSDVTGRSLNNISLTSTHNQLNTCALSSGVYLITAVKGGIRVVQRLLIGR